MSVGLDHPEVTPFLATLREAAVVLPPGRREELVAEISDHLRDALAGGGGSDAAVRQVLDRLGDPADIVAAEVESAGLAGAGPAGAGAVGTGPLSVAAAGGGPVDGARPAGPAGLPWPSPQASPWGVLEVSAVLLLTVGTFVVPFIGPLVGLVLAWGSMRWTRREKVVATVLTLLPTVAIGLFVASLFVLRF